MTNASDDNKLLDNLMADPITARLVVAWRRSVLEYEAACLAATDDHEPRLVDSSQASSEH